MRCRVACRLLFLPGLVIFLLGLPLDRAAAQPEDRLTQPGFWKEQGLDVLASWTRHAQDTEHGAFHSHLDRRWQPFDGSDKYPGMVARHVFSYSVAYLLSGDPDHLEVASEATDFMVEHGWDERYGGWYNAVSREGAVTDSTKDLFMQLYAATGLTLYYTATHDDRALDYVEQTNRLLETHAWDGMHGGYVRSLNRDLSVRTPHKDFTPQGAALSGYLLYLYHATRDTAYLDQMERVMDVMMGPMRQPSPPWIYERFAENWEFLPDDSRNSSINIGHNIELGWLLLRMQDLIGSGESYRQEALSLGDSLRQRALVSSGAWTTDLELPGLTDYPDEASWWMQAYGNMFMLTLYEATEDSSVLRDFRRGGQFWNQAFVDSTYGGTVLKTTLQGEVIRGDKAVRSKTSYHTLEHALLNYLYLSLWVENEPITLHFRIENPASGEKLYPLPINAEAAIQRVTINGDAWGDFDTDTVYLPASEGPLPLTVTMR